MILRSVALGLASLVLAACPTDEPSSKTTASLAGNTAGAVTAQPAQRWYESAQVSQGSRVFLETCAACHGQLGEGAPNWKKLGPDGKYPAPPLNGTGHAWYHPLKILFHVIENGSPGGQGDMPAWGEKLSDEEMIAAIAWFQSNWPEEIYSAWTQRELASRNKGG